MKKRPYILIALVVIVGFLGYEMYVFNTSREPVRQATTADSSVELPKVGYRAPSFTLKSFDGTSYSMPPLDGRPIVLNFWASWCDPCKTEAPELTALYGKYKDQLEIYAVNVTLDDDKQEAKAFAEKYGFQFPVLLDDDSSNMVAPLYQIQPIPTTFFINRKGIIVEKLVGLADPAELEKKFRNVIAR